MKKPQWKVVCQWPQYGPRDEITGFKSYIECYCYTMRWAMCKAARLEARFNDSGPIFSVYPVDKTKVASAVRQPDEDTLLF